MNILNNLKLIQKSQMKEIDFSIIKYNNANRFGLLREDFNFIKLKKHLNTFLYDDETTSLINSLKKIDEEDFLFLLDIPLNIQSDNNIYFEIQDFKDTLSLPNFIKNLHLIRNEIQFSICTKFKTNCLFDILMYMENNTFLNFEHFNFFIKTYITLFENNSYKIGSFNKNYFLTYAASPFAYRQFYFDIYSEKRIYLKNVKDIKHIPIDFKNAKIDNTINDNIKKDSIKKLKFIDLEILGGLTKYCYHKNSIKLLKNLYDMSKNKNCEWETLLKKISKLEEIGTNLFDVLLAQVYEHSNLTTVNGIDKILDYIISNKIITKNIYEQVYGEKHIISFCIHSNFDKCHIDFLKKNLDKKRFLKVLSENLDLYNRLSRDNILFNDTFSKVINLNTLDESALKILEKTENQKSKYYLSPTNKENIPNLNPNKILTFKELNFLLKESLCHILLYYRLYDLNIKIDSRLILTKQLPCMTAEHMSMFNCSMEDLLSNVVNKITQTPFKDFVNNIKKKFINLNSLNNISLFIIFLEEEKMSPYLEDITTDTDITYLLKNYKHIKESNLSIYRFKLKQLFEDVKFLYLVETLELTKEFIDNNINSILSFYEKGLHIIFYKLMNNGIQKKLQKNNLKLLVKSELTNRLSEIKFQDSDFDLEIGMKISDEVKQEWKTNLSKRFCDFMIYESYDFNDLIRLGQYPVSTCQHWNGGSYSRCLLSNFDTNKKMIVSKLHDKTNSRALLRITKGTIDNVENENKNLLKFKDIDDLVVGVSTQPNEELILFLEKIYSNLDNIQLKFVKKEFIGLAKEKADKLGAKLVVSGFYEDVLETQEPTMYNIFISYSKNEYQYLDSLNGEVPKVLEGCYVPTNVFLLN